MATRTQRRTLGMAAGGSLLLGVGVGAGIGATSIAAGSAAADGFVGDLTFTVDSLTDISPADPLHCDPLVPVVGSCTLRDAITAANDFATAYDTTSTIVFDPSISGTIELTANLPYIVGSTAITGPGSDRLTIEGNGTFGGFMQEIIPGSDPNSFVPIDLTISGLTLRGLTAAPTLTPDTTAHLRPSDLPFEFRPTAINLAFGSLTVRDTVVTGSGSRGANAFFIGWAPITAGALAYFYRGGENFPSTSVTLDNVDVAYNVGETDVPYYELQTSGSLIAFAADVSITNSSFRHNVGTTGGGPIVFGRTVTIADVDINDNVSNSNVGGLGVIAERASIERTLISGNTAQTNAGLIAYGGLFYAEENSHVDISDSAIIGNASLYGQVVALASSTARIDRSSIVANSVTDVYPLAAGSVRPAFDVTMRTTLMLYSETAIDSSTIVANSAAAIMVVDPSSQVGSATATTNIGRGRLGLGGGDRTRAAREFGPTAVAQTARLHLAHSTIAHNADGGIMPVPWYQALTPATPESPTVWLDHSLLAGNGTDDLGVPATAWFSLVQRASIVPTDAPADHNQIGVDPKFSTLGLPFSCPTPLVCVVPIEMGTPAWNAGDPLFSPPPSTDQRGEPRVVEIIDIGAYEVQVLIPKFTG